MKILILPMTVRSVLMMLNMNTVWRMYMYSSIHLLNEDARLTAVIEW